VEYSIPPVLMHVWKQKRSEWLLFVAMTKEGTKKINEEQESSNSGSQKTTNEKVDRTSEENSTHTAVQRS